MSKKLTKKGRSSSIKTKSKKKNYTREDYIRAYIKAKKGKLDNQVKKDDFATATGLPRRGIYDLFSNYSELKQIGENRFTEALPRSERALLSERSKKFNPEASKEDCITDLRSIQEAEPLKHITRNYYRTYGKYSDATWDQFFGTFQEFRRQAGLELSRHHHALERSIAKHASHDHYRTFFNTEILPYFRKYEKEDLATKIKKIMIISDVHDEEADDFTVAVFVEECRLKQPDVIVLNGDIFDLYEFSRYTQDPRNYSIKDRFKWIWDNLFAPLRKHCPNAQIDFIMGNHEFRLIRLLADATPNIRILLADILELEFKDVFKVDEYQINWVSKANFSAFTKKDINDQLKQNHTIYYGCYAVCHEPDESLKHISGTNGHHHRLEHRSNAYLDPVTNKQKQTTWVQTPAAHAPDAEYLTRLSKWNTGFLEVTVNNETKEVIQNIRQTHADWTVIDGVLYEREEEE